MLLPVKFALGPCHGEQALTRSEKYTCPRAVHRERHEKNSRQILRGSHQYSPQRASPTLLILLPVKLLLGPCRGDQALARSEKYTSPRAVHRERHEKNSRQILRGSHQELSPKSVCSSSHPTPS